jgi:hypothetical protein
MPSGAVVLPECIPIPLLCHLVRVSRPLESNPIEEQEGFLLQRFTQGEKGTRDRKKKGEWQKIVENEFFSYKRAIVVHCAV